MFILISSLLVLFIICTYPFVSFLYETLLQTNLAQNISKLMASGSTLLAFKNTLLVSSSVCVISILLALPLAWFLTRSDLPKKGFWRTSFCLPYAIPPYVGAIAWIVLGNPSNGILNELFGMNLNVYTLGGLIWVMSSFFYTFILISLMSAMERLDPSLEEAARLSGATPLRVFFQITLPLIKPSLLSGIVLVFLAASASFGVPALIGNPAGIYMLTTKIYTYQKMGSFSGLHMAGLLSILLLLLAVVSLVINQQILKRSKYSIVSGKTARHSLIKLGVWTKPIKVFLSVLFFTLFLLPLSGILISALSKVQGIVHWSNFGIQNFGRLFFEVTETYRAFLNSTLLAGGAATVAVGLSVFLAYFQLKVKVRGRGIINILTSIPYATPGTVLAFAFILSFGRGIFSLYNTLLLIGIAYLSKYLNFALRTTTDGMNQVDSVLEEAARVSGASWWMTMRTIWFPLLTPALMASWFFVFMPAFSELTMSVLLTGPGLETLGTLLFQLQEYGDASGGGSSVLALMIIVFILVMNTSVKKLSKGKYGL